jgi:hypothetical protein
MEPFLQNERKSDYSFENDIQKENEEIKKTIIKFVVYDYDNNNNDNYYNKIHLKFINKSYNIIIKKENNNNVFSIIFDGDDEQLFIENEIEYYYTEIITLKYNDNENSKSFNLTIYLNEENNVNIFLNKYQQQSYSYELLYESFNTNYLPKNIPIADTIFNNFDTFGDKFSKRLNIINVIDDKLIEDIKKPSKEISYKISYRIENINKINKIIQIYEEEKKREKINIDNNKIINILNAIKPIDEKINDLLNKYSLINENNYENIKKIYFEIINEFNKYSNDFLILNEEPKNFNNMNDNILNLLYYYEIYQLLNIIKEKNEFNNLNLTIELIKIYDSIVEQIKKLKIFISTLNNLSLIDKFYIIRGYTDILLKIYDSDENIEYLFEGKIQFISNNNNDFYSIAFNKIKDIINNINEDSFLYKHFKQINSPYSQIINEVDINQNQNEFNFESNLISNNETIEEDNDEDIINEYKNDLIKINNNINIDSDDNSDDNYINLLENYLVNIKKYLKRNDYGKVNRLEKKKNILLKDYSKSAINDFNFSNSIFELNLLNLNKVKNHILKILNCKFILRIECYNNFRSNTQIENGNFIVINDFNVFNKSIDKIDNQIKNINVEFRGNFDYYISPLVMEIFHEINHVKILRKESNNNTPIHSKHIKNITQSITLFNEKMECGESGKIFEQNLGTFYINFLKNPANGDIDLLDFHLWIGSNFNDLRGKIEDKIKKSKNNKKNDFVFFDNIEHLFYNNCLEISRERRKMRLEYKKKYKNFNDNNN